MIKGSDGLGPLSRDWGSNDGLLGDDKNFLAVEA